MALINDALNLLDENRVKTQRLLIAVARAAHTLCDNTEESGPVRKPELKIDHEDFERLSKALDALDELPELPAPNIGTGPAKAEYLLGLT